MKRIVGWILVFAFGIGVGRVLEAREAEEEDERLPSFSWESQPDKPPATVSQTKEEETRPQKQGLPWKLEYTSLVARELVCYDGPCLESGSDEEVIGITALILENTGTVGLEYVHVVLTQGGRELSFDATYVPPRAAVMILEDSYAPYSRDPVEDCRCRTLIPGSFDWSDDAVQVRPDGFCSMAVTNLTEKAIPCVRVFYKQHDGETDTYIGGITYSAILPELQPGETRIISPYRYATGYCGVVAVVTET